MSPSAALYTSNVRDSNRFELEALCRLIRRSPGCSLAFCWANHPSLVAGLTGEAKRRLEGLEIAEITMDPSREGGFVEQWEELLGNRRPAALFVYGIERMIDFHSGYTHSLGVLNLNRGYIANRFPFPIVFWGPDHAMVEFSRQAPDTWSSKSDSVHFRGEDSDIAATLARLDREDFLSLDASVKLERKLHLECILRETEPGSPVHRARALYLLASALIFDGRAEDAGRLLNDAVSLFRDAGMKGGEARCHKLFGEISRISGQLRAAAAHYERAIELHRATMRGSTGLALALLSHAGVLGDLLRYAEAAKVLDEAAGIFGRLGDRLGFAKVALGRSALEAKRAETLRAEEWARSALEGFRALGDRFGEAEALATLASLTRGRDSNAANRLCEAALALYDQIGYKSGKAWALWVRGEIAFQSSRFEDAARAMEVSAQTAREAGDKLVEAGALWVLGDKLQLTGRASSALEYLERAQRIYESMDSRIGIAQVFGSMAEIYQRQGLGARAIDLLKQALAVFRETRNRHGVATTLLRIATISGPRDPASPLMLEEARREYESLEDHNGVANVQRQLGWVRFAAGDFRGSLDHFRVAMDLHARTGSALGYANAAYDAGQLGAMIPGTDSASKLFEEALRIYRELGVVGGEANVLHSLGDLERARSNFERAGELYQAALPKFRQTGNRAGEARCLQSMGLLAKSRSDHASADRILTESARIFEVIGNTESATLARSAMSR